MKWASAFVLSFSIGAACRYFEIPCPAPNAILGGLLVLTMTVGYCALEYFLAR